MSQVPVKYTEANIRSLEWNEHIRRRPGMYIGRLGDGAAHDDGIYILLKETIDNSIDEFTMGCGKRIDVAVTVNPEGTQTVTVRDFGRGIPLGSVIDCAGKPNTGGKYDSEAFQRSVGLNGVGLKAVNALSKSFVIQSFREEKTRKADFATGNLTADHGIKASKGQKSGTLTTFTPDPEIFPNYSFKDEYIENLLWNYAYLNMGLTLTFNGKVFKSENGLLDLLNQKIDGSTAYKAIHLKDSAGLLEIVFTHATQYGEEYYSFTNGQHTTQGGTHQLAFRDAVVKALREFFKKDYDAADIRTGIIAAISIRVQEPIFESQTKTKLGSQTMTPNGGVTIRNYVSELLKKELDNFLHRSPAVAQSIQQKIQQNERERKELAGIRDIARDAAKKVSLHNSKLRDCRIHFNDKAPRRGDDDKRGETTLFITEGDSASGSITKVRDPNAQAVFSLKGKPLNTHGKSRRIMYENDELSMLHSALNVEAGMEELRYNNIVLATDADVDGMHIRLLLITFFLTFLPELIKNGHLYILQTPLFRVRNKKETRYCYSEPERVKAMAALGPQPEVTRFKGLGEISPDEFRHFIGPKIRLEPVIIGKESPVEKLLQFYMGANTPDRQEFIIRNLAYTT
ncbi:MAG: topoisomerase [Chthoniobacteraceae bacterium]|nr:topoisomerase [Chthoniobacteraceae bacterium]